MSSSKNGKGEPWWKGITFLEKLFNGIDFSNIDWKALFFNLLDALTWGITLAVTRGPAFIWEHRNHQALRFFIPIILISLWNYLVEILDFSFGAEAKVPTLIWRSVFFVKTGVTWFVCWQINQGLQKAIGEGDMEDEITVEKTEMNNETMKMEKRSERMTLGDYDNEELWKFLKQQGMQLLPVLGIHYYYQYTIPLVISSVMGVSTLFEMPLYLVHVKGLTEWDNKLCKRPFKSQDPMEFVKNMQQNIEKLQGDGEEEEGSSSNAGWSSVTASKKLSSKSLKMQEKAWKASEKRKVK